MPRYPKVPKGWTARDIEWHVPNRKRPIAYSTQAANNLIVTLSQSGRTIQEVRNMIRYDSEAQKVLDAYIAKGYGETIAQEFFK